ncbi:cation:proton antiporter [Desulfobacca acetoxidans]|uniref:Sodium/hydrogen exchanger n=1 Tax=Desulfobacca acetoxidans (strain ATCC 700848 / DSM 11109 / ASRB2) TaxID=880072 RepID=F2NDZ8_DESAR|nr:cation:proton antiporter [Desulfobacca acetoxidans]AEB10566.1 sodium/hydrogen exchanger [Desulfobacca acetoxidans DSM 11109]
MEHVWFTAASWIGLALLASLISIRTGVSVALVEIFLGMVGGNFLGFHTVPWIDVLAAFGSMMLTFLAGAEIDPVSFRKHLKPSLVIGGISFLAPFLGAMAFTYFVNGWDLRAAQIAGVALSTTSVAVVYAVMIETRLNEVDIGKLILAACFVTDLGTVLALGVLFATYNRWMLVFVVVTGLALWVLPRLSRWMFKKYGGRVSEPEVKFIFLVLCFLGALAVTASSEAVLPAYLFGLVVAGVFVQDKILIQRMRTITFTLLTPFFFIKAGALISLPALAASLGLIALLFMVKMVTKIVGVWPLTRFYRMGKREGNYCTLLMATGLTFGSISALYGLTNGIINQAQYSVLVTVVIASAVVPTFIAQTWFQPKTTVPYEPIVFGTSDHFLHYPEEI